MNLTHFLRAVAAGLLVLAATACAPVEKKPAAPTSTPVKSETAAEDPYLWLEDIHGEKPLEWVHDAANTIRRPDLRTRAFYPLTMPLIVGPGSISVAITLGANQSHGFRPLIVDSLAHASGALLVAVAIFVTLRYAEPILRRFGATGTAVLLRMSAFILLCIGVQIIWNGAAALVRGLPSA